MYNYDYIKKTLSLFLLFVSPVVSAQNNKVFKYKDSIFEVNSVHYLPVRYNYGSYEMICDSIAKKCLFDLAEFLKNHPQIKIRLENHTDQRGADNYNLKLSDLRIKSVLSYFIETYSVDTHQVVAKGCGELKPVLSEKYIGEMRTEKEEKCAYRMNRRTIARIIEINTKLGGANKD